MWIPRSLLCRAASQGQGDSSKELCLDVTLPHTPAGQRGNSLVSLHPKGLGYPVWSLAWHPHLEQPLHQPIGINLT